jgi:hypothetical protein
MAELQDKAELTDRDHEELKLLYQATISDLAFFKQ